MVNYLRVIPDTPEEIKKLLYGFTEYDNDFNGNNGKEYLWSEAAEEGFDSNADYVYSKAKQEKTSSKLIEKFISMWMMSDPYFKEFSIEVLEIPERNLLAVSLSYI